MKVIVIGGGPAGMLAAIAAAEQGNNVIILEKMNSLGRKLIITGKGRCNVTSSLPIEDFIKNIPGNGRFLYSAFQNFTNEDIINLLAEEGVKCKEERGNRVFPVTDRSVDVLNALLSKLKKLNVKIYTNEKVENILVKEIIIDSNKDDCNSNIKQIKNLIKVIGVKTGERIYEADKVILATGGKSYPTTGSTGDGYKMAQKLGHTITKIMPSLVALTCNGKSLEICKMLQGLSLRNVRIRFINNKKTLYDDFGEMLFTHFGVSGPTILSGSAHLIRKDIENTKLTIDLKPALSEEKLDERLLRDFEKAKNKEFRNSLDELLPQKLIPVIINLSNINEHKRINEITKEERRKIVQLLKNFEIEISGFRPVEEAIVTAGGINIKEINPKTMESKLVSGLYFAGEVIDVDAYTGGFNLQIAYSTGFTAGL